MYCLDRHFTSSKPVLEGPNIAVVCEKIRLGFDFTSNVYLVTGVGGSKYKTDDKDTIGPLELPLACR